jgi:hypothetical protein
MARLNRYEDERKGKVAASSGSLRKAYKLQQVHVKVTTVLAAFLLVHCDQNRVMKTSMSIIQVRSRVALAFCIHCSMCS